LRFPFRILFSQERPRFLASRSMPSIASVGQKQSVSQGERSQGRDCSSASGVVGKESSSPKSQRFLNVPTDTKKWRGGGKRKVKKPRDGLRAQRKTKKDRQDARMGEAKYMTGTGNRETQYSVWVHIFLHFDISKEFNDQGEGCEGRVSVV
jgi:hypothetical protein